MEKPGGVTKTQNNNTNIVGNVKIKLFYNVSCPYSQAFLVILKNDSY